MDPTRASPTLSQSEVSFTVGEEKEGPAEFTALQGQRRVTLAEITACSAALDMNVPELIGSLTRTEVLDFSFDPASRIVLSEDLMTAIYGPVNSVIELILDGQRIAYPALRSLTAFPHLRRLSLRNCEGINDHCLFALSAPFLHFHNTPNFPDITEMCLTGCAISAAALGRLRAHRDLWQIQSEWAENRWSRLVVIAKRPNSVPRV
jgi:hypothetical protein